MANPKKPYFYKKLIELLEHTYTANDYSILKIDYVGSTKVSHHNSKFYNFLVFGKDDDGDLCIWLDTLDYLDSTPEIIHSTLIEMSTLEYLKNLNLETIKVLYGRV